MILQYPRDSVSAVGLSHHFAGRDSTYLSNALCLRVRVYFPLFLQISLDVAFGLNVGVGHQLEAVIHGTCPWLNGIPKLIRFFTSSKV